MSELTGPTVPLPVRCSKTGHILFSQSPLQADAQGLIALPSYDLIVIGGGINGTGIARDAALRGLRVLLLEKTDFGAGTSAYSSRLIHGGLRYLANLELDLVYESLAERELLLKNAPHLVRPLALALPVYSGGKTPLWMIELGMCLYDLLSFRKSLPWHRLYAKKDLVKRYPALSSAGLCGGSVYYDAQVEYPELVCMENVLSAQETGNASMFNHAQVSALQQRDGRISGVIFEDLLTGQRYQASAQGVINAAGPWLDRVIALASASGSDTTGAGTVVPRIGGTLGTHIVVPRFPQGPDTALYVEAQSDGRPFFIIPWRGAFYLIGTTDLPFTGDLDWAAGSLAEVEYLLRETNRVLPQATLTLADVLYTYAGVRPLPAVPPSLSKDQPGKISRKHWIEDHAQDRENPLPGLISVIGGKLTTYRNLAQVTVDRAIHSFGLRLAQGENVPTCSTRSRPLPGGEGITDLFDFKAQQVPAAAQRYGLSPAIVAHLIDLYGSRFHRVLALLDEVPALAALIDDQALDIKAQVIYAVRFQMACTVSDVMLRRVGCAFNADAGLRSVETVARCMATELGWSPERTESEVEQYRCFVQKRHLGYQGQAAWQQSPCTPVSSHPLP